MMNQQKNMQKGNRRLPLLLLTMLLAMTLLCTFAIAVSADGTDVPVTADNLKVNLDQRADGVYTKVYDGIVDADVEVKTQPNFGSDTVVLEIESARFDSVNAGDTAAIVVTFRLTGADAAKYETPAPVRIPVVIEKKTVSWTANGTASATYTPGTTLYENLAVTLPGTDKLDGVLAADLAGIALNGDYKVSVNASAAGTVQGQVLVDIGNENYILEPLTVDVAIGKVQLISVTWSVDDFSFIYGDSALGAITALGYDSLGNPYQMTVQYPEGYGNASSTAYLITAVPADSANVELGTALNSKEVYIRPATYVVSMENATYVGDGTSTFAVSVVGLPAELRDGVVYTDKTTGAAFTSTAAYGKYTIVAALPLSTNWTFVNAAGETVTRLEATLCVNRSSIVSTGPDGEAYNIIVVGEDGFDADIVANLTIPESLGNAIRGFRIHKAYSLSLSNVGAEDSFTLLISTYEELLHKNCDALTAADLYIYEPSTGELVAANTKYTVTLKEGYYEVEGYEGSATTTFVIAPTYHTPFLLTAPGIALLILLVLALIVILFFIGIRLRRVTRGENEVLTMDTEGETPEVVPAQVEDVAAEDALDALADEIAGAVEPSAEEAAEEVDADAEKAEAMAQLMSEVAEISLEEEDSTVAEDFADDKAEALKDEVDALVEETEADEDAIRDAVAAAMADAVNESADAEDAVVILAADEEEEMDAVDFRTVINEIVCGAMSRTMVLPTEDAETSEQTDDAPAAQEAAPVEAGSEEDITAIVADVVAEAFELLIADGVEPKAVDGTTKETIAEAVEAAAAEAIPAEWSEELAAEIKAAVVEELAARLIVEAPVIETLAVVDEDNEDDDNDDNDNDDDEEGFGGFGGFGDLKLHYIDVMAEPEEYAALLEQEAAGEIRIVYRLKKSFQSRVIQSQGNVQTYYSAIKNAILSYKGNKGRISWNYEAFNKGRIHVAKVNAKLKTLYLYLALDPEELADTKYGIVDVSSKKKYASVPVLMKIKGDRKFKYALELIEKLCGEQMQLPKLEAEETDYTMPYKTTDELIEEGVIKKLAAGVPIEYFAQEETPAETVEEAPAEEPAIEAVPATEFAIEASAEPSAEEAETTEG